MDMNKLWMWTDVLNADSGCGQTFGLRRVDLGPSVSPLFLDFLIFLFYLFLLCSISFAFVS